MTQPPSKRLATEAYVTSAVASAITSALGGMGLSGSVSDVGQLTATNLGANASYTQAAQDLGALPKDRATKLRLVALHTAGQTPASLIVQTSTDSTTWREVWRSPIPSDGLYHTYSTSLYHRYYRIIFTNGAVAQTAMWLGASLTAGEAVGNGDTATTLTFPMTPAAGSASVAASAVVNGPTIDLGPDNSWNIARLWVGAPNAATVVVQQSMDGTTWFSGGNITVTANVAAPTDVAISARYLRYVFTQGATAGIYRATMTLVAA